VKQFLRLTAGATREGYVNRLRLLTRYDVRTQLRDIRSPTLFLAAEEDHLVPSVMHAEYMARQVPAATLRILDGHGHACLIAPGVDLAQILADWREPEESLPDAGT
jgi:pimeloyl-ACP methyl ester carboxylesterase